MGLRLSLRLVCDCKTRFATASPSRKLILESLLAWGARSACSTSVCLSLPPSVRLGSEPRGRGSVRSTAGALEWLGFAWLGTHVQRPPESSPSVCLRPSVWVPNPAAVTACAQQRARLSGAPCLRPSPCGPVRLRPESSVSVCLRPSAWIPNSAAVTAEFDFRLSPFASVRPLGFRTPRL